jgi:hypothetical protein
MKRFALLAFMAAGLVCPSINAQTEPGKIEEIRQYFELRDTISLVNLEMKRAMAPDSRSPMLLEKDAEKNLNSLMQFLDGRIQQFAQSNTPLKYHYVKKLNGLFGETRQLYGSVVVKMRTRTLAEKSGSLIAQGNTEKNGEPAQQGTDKIQPRPYFHPIDLRTLLSPALLNKSRLSVDAPASSSAAVPKTVPEEAAGTNTVASQAPAIQPAKPVPVIAKTPVALPVMPEEKKPADVAGKTAGKVSEPQTVKNIPTASAAAVIPTDRLATSTSVVPTVAVPDKPVKKVEPVKKAVVETVKPPAIAPAGEGFMRPMAIMIENHNKSRPQTGLDQADMVYEMPVEGGITRFMAIFNRLPAILGPVRSCREYFIDRALELDALYVHCGASPTGYNYISKTGIKSIDEIKHSPPFFRDNTRKAPHNLYSKGPSLYEYMSEKVAMRLKDQPSLFLKTGAARPGNEPGLSVRIRYHGNYMLDIKYDDGAYQRYMNDELHVDRITQKPLRFQTFVMQVASMKTVDAVGRQEISFIGSGTAWIFDSGRMTKVTWKKETPRTVTSYTDMNGKEYVFSGNLPVWVQVVSPNHKVFFNGAENPIGFVAETPANKTASDSAITGKQG